MCNSPEQRLLVHHVIYTETMTTIINIVQKLDLSAAQPNQDHVSLCVRAYSQLLLISEFKANSIN